MNRVEVALENIPEELKERDQWLLWDASAERKQPFTLKSARLAPASWNDPDNWLGFDETADFAEDREHVGIGYVFAKANDDYARGVYGGLDLDGCFADGAPEDWLPELQPFLERDAYVEFSPSRADPEKESHGAHIPLAGFEPPEWWSDVNLGDHEGVEAYGSKFFTFTGDRARSSGDEVADTGDWVEEWLADAYEAVTGETAPPRQDDGQGTSRTTSAHSATTRPQRATGAATTWSRHWTASTPAPSPRTQSSTPGTTAPAPPGTSGRSSPPGPVPPATAPRTSSTRTSG